MSEVRYVLDASALLAAMLGERGAQTVAAHFSDACISSVNLSEVVAKLSERGVPDESIHESLSDLDLDVRDFNTAQALRAGALRNPTKSKGLSLGDRACLAPDLGGSGARWSEGQLRLRLVDSQRLNPQTIMPSYHCTDGFERVGAAWRGKPVLGAQQVEDVVAFLRTLK